MLKFTTEDFVRKATLRHGDLYDYCKVIYTHSHQPVTIICRKHGEFEQKASLHLRGAGCIRCQYENSSLNARLSLEDFIRQANLKHNNRYDYSLTRYVNTATEVDIICLEHGVFKQKPRTHLTGSGCQVCGKLSFRATTSLGTEKFIERSKVIHGDRYDYSLVNYATFKEKVRIICKVHGEFLQLPSNHLDGAGCYECGQLNVGKATLSNNEEFCEKARTVHGNLYDYSLVDYVHSHVKVKVICPEHGEFMITPGKHIEGVGCKKCKSSKGEKAIMVILDKHKVPYIPEYTIPNQLFVHRYDFYLPQQNILIEFHGRQHYEMCEYFGGEAGFKATVIRDERKKNLAMVKRIKLLVFNTEHLKIPRAEFERLLLEGIGLCPPH